MASMLSYGAKGDGVSNDYAAIQAALDAGEEDIVIPAGMYMQETNDRMARGWESRRGEEYREIPVAPPVFEGHPRVARDYSRQIALFALRVFHNREESYYGLANRKIIENCRFYIENTDVRDDRDSFYWNIGELCRCVIHFGKSGDQQPGLAASSCRDIRNFSSLGHP